MKKLSLLSLLFLQSAFADENEGLKVNPDHFITEGLLEPIKVEEKKLSNGEIADCYVIKTKSQPLEHKMGPWSPKTISDGKGGLWFEGGKLHNVDGAFIKNMATFYKDDKWKLYNEDGTLKVTETKEAFLLAARPNVDPAYQNHVVEGDPAWVKDLDFTYYIPVQPVALEKPGKLQR